MSNLTAIICLTIAVLFGSVGVSFALPECPSGQNQYYDNCFGTYTSANGSKYVGEFRNGKRNGQGTYTRAYGDKYVGEWKDGKPNGQATRTYADGRIKEGVWKNDVFQYAQKVTPPVIAEENHLHLPEGIQTRTRLSE